ncbi:MAG: xanthine dehydrogenase family protein subunit M [Betaproteobacteria bacterium]|nr:xanthine dehydrogenase family protein subunit M [Betaproteobacteria bacterium]
MKLPGFDYIAPATAQEAVALLAQNGGGAKVIAGGQSLIPTMAFRLARPSLLVDLRNVASLRGIMIDDTGVRLGAMTRWRDIENDPALRTAHPLLVAAVRHVAHYQIRNRGTVGGSLAHADPAAELPCIAVTCEATLRILGPTGERECKTGDFFLGPLATALSDDEVIVEVKFPRWPRERRWGFQEFSRRQGDFALAGIALFHDLDASGRAMNAHVGVFGAGQFATRLPRAEAALNGSVVTDALGAKAAAIAADEVDPPEDLHASAPYRRALVATMLERALAQSRSDAP